MKYISVNFKNQKILVREVKQEDVSDVWRWRNDKIARANSLDVRRISFQKHKSWFVRQLRNNKVKIYIATIKKMKIGMVRFDFVGKNTIEISINMNPTYRGKGLGKRVLKKMSKFMRQEYPRRIQKAIIKSANFVSERIFSSTQFIKVYEVDKPAYSVWIKKVPSYRPLRIFFMGNNWLGWKIANWLHQRNEQIVGLGLHPKEKQKYGKQIIESVKISHAHIFDGSQLKKQKVINAIKKLKPDFGLSAFFGYILDQEFINLFPAGCVNLHTAFLPNNRGAHPNVWSIAERTPAGASIHYIDKGVDTGNIIAREQLAVNLTDTGASLYVKLERLAFNLFKRVWPLIRSGQLHGIRQNKREGSFHMLRDLKDIDKIDLNRSYEAKQLINILRARTFPPHAGAYYEENGQKIYLQLQLLEEKDLKKEKINGNFYKN